MSGSMVLSQVFPRVKCLLAEAQKMHAISKAKTKAKEMLENNVWLCLFDGFGFLSRLGRIGSNGLICEWVSRNCFFSRNCL